MQYSVYSSRPAAHRWQKDEAKAELMKSTRALETLRLETTKNEQMAEQAKEALRILQDRYE